MQTYDQTLKNLRAQRRRVLIAEVLACVAIVAAFFTVLGVAS